MAGTDILFKMPDHSRIWIYASPEPLSVEVAEQAVKMIDDFTASWNSHGEQVVARGILIHARMIILAVDEEKAAVSGCSIDSSVQLIRSVGAYSGLDFLSRDYIYRPVGDDIEVERWSELRDQADHPWVQDDVEIYDFMVRTLGEWRRSGLKPISQSWLQRVM